MKQVHIMTTLMAMICGGQAFIPLAQPGVSKPLGFFDPLGFSKNRSPLEFKKIQEAEVKHSRVAMLAALGLLTQDVFHPLFHDETIGSPIYHYQIVSEKYPLLTPLLLGTIGTVELFNIKNGWEKRSLTDGIAELTDNYVPGNLGFDPLQLVKTPEDFHLMRTRELNNGRLAMIASVIIILQQYINSHHSL